MPTKQRLIRYLAALAIFAAADIWIFATLRSTLRDDAARSRDSSLALLAKSAPTDLDLIGDWLASVPGSLPGGAAIYLEPSEDDPYAYEPYAADPAALALWLELEPSDDAQKGLDSAYYFENYASPAKATLDDTTVRLFYAPITDETEGELLGVAVFMAPETAAPGIERLLTVFAIGAFALFAALTGVSRFARDPTVGYAVLTLAGLSVVFIVFPLIEAFRLSFMKDGQASLAVWAD
ncbi:MAG TPA: hypothetical protein PLE25_07850, partial [Spirochaetales bacterium]|nr:hypothetical protein [Spirochaetales bacterium]